MLRFLGSSANPEQVSATIKGIAISLVPFIALLFHVDQLQINQYVDLLIQTVTYGMLLYGNILAIFGLLRKAYFWIKGLLNK